MQELTFDQVEEVSGGWVPVVLVVLEVASGMIGMYELGKVAGRSLAQQ